MTTQQVLEVIFSDYPVDLTNFFPPISPGFDWVWSFSKTDDNDGVINTTGWAVEMDIREMANGPRIVKLSTTNGAIVNDNNGTFTVTFLGTSNANISARKLVTDIKVTDNTGKTNNEINGSISVEEIVTR
jgi:hypothetical protein